MHSIVHIDWLNDVKNCVSNFSIYVCCICVCLCDLATFVSFFFFFLFSFFTTSNFLRYSSKMLCDASCLK